MWWAERSWAVVTAAIAAAVTVLLVTLLAVYFFYTWPLIVAAGSAGIVFGILGLRSKGTGSRVVTIASIGFSALGLLYAVAFLVYYAMLPWLTCMSYPTSMLACQHMQTGL